MALWGHFRKCPHLRRLKKGFTLVEVMVAVFILFLVSFYLLQLFGTGANFFGRSKRFTTATLLAQEKMEETLAQTQISAASGTFSAPYDKYSWTVTVAPYVNPLLETVTVLVQGPLMAKSVLVSLAQAPVFFGVSSDTYSNVVALSSNASQRVDYYNGNSFSRLPALPGSGIPTGVAIDLYANVGWAGDKKNRVIWYYNGSSWQGPFQPPGNLGTMGVPAGLASDSYASVVFVADLTNKCLWKFNQQSGTWTGPLKPSSPALGEPAGIAVDPSTSVVWMVDVTNSSLWKYDDTAGSWTQYTPSGLSNPRGVVITSDGQTVFVVDSANLWKYSVSTGILSLVTFLPSVIGSPSGLASDQSTSTFWVNDYTKNLLWYWNGSIWTFRGPYP